VTIRYTPAAPVGRTSVLALLRAKAKPEESKLVFSDVYLVASKTLLEKTLSAGTGSSPVSRFPGLCRLGVPGSLNTKWKAGGWFIFRATADSVFRR